MKKKLNCVLLVDDDESTNFLHELIIKQAGVTEKVIAEQSGASALEYLRSKSDGAYPQPDLIFLDINMPGMNGWEFLEEYKKLDKGQQGKFVVVMLTTSLHPEDEEKAQGMAEIDDFKNKPLTVDMLHEVIEKNFSEYL
ncbi:MAG: response regulator [Cyclobacteriaceae bacterium]